MMKVQQEATNALKLYFFQDIQEDGYDYVRDEVVSETSSNTLRKTLERASEVKQIEIHINSLGGSCKEGIAIYNLLTQHPAEKTVYVDGWACSAASVIAMAGDQVIMPKASMMMIHNAWTIACGNAEELRKVADDVEKISAATHECYLQKSGGKITAEELGEMMARETWLSAEDCIKYGFADAYEKQEEPGTAEPKAEATQQAKVSAIKLFCKKRQQEQEKLSKKLHEAVQNGPFESKALNEMFGAFFMTKKEE